MKRVAIYMRVSTDRQANEGDSIPAQRQALRKYIDDHSDMILADEYLDDGISGTKESREELQRMLSDVQNGKIDLILCTKMDRLHRNMRNFLNMQDILDKHYVNWLAIWEPMYDTSTPQGRMIINTMMNLAQFEAENTAQRIQQVFTYKARQGEVLSGMQPFGYDIVDKHLVPNENASIAMRAFQKYAETGNLNETTRFLAEETGVPRIKHTVKAMLQNRKYIGEYRDNPNYCPAIIPVNLFEDVQRKLSMNIKQSQKHIYIFAGLIRCGDCGRRFSGNRLHKKERSGNRHERFTYRCPVHYIRKELRGEDKSCQNGKIIAEAVLERKLISSIRDDLEKIIASAKQEQTQKKDNSAKIANLQRKIDKLKELYINDLISIEEYKKDKSDYLSSIESLKKQDDFRCRDTTAIEKFLQIDFESFYFDLSRENKRNIWRSIIKEITFDHDRNIKITYL